MKASNGCRISHLLLKLQSFILISRSTGASRTLKSLNKEGHTGARNRDQPRRTVRALQLVGSRTPEEHWLSTRGNCDRPRCPRSYERMILLGYASRGTWIRMHVFVKHSLLRSSISSCRRECNGQAMHNQGCGDGDRELGCESAKQGGTQYPSNGQNAIDSYKGWRQYEFHLLAMRNVPSHRHTKVLLRH